jgi:hypothetical protein
MGEVMSEIQLKAHARPFWPAVVIAIGISLTISWTILLGYGVFKLVKFAI